MDVQFMIFILTHRSPLYHTPFASDPLGLKSWWHLWHFTVLLGFHRDRSPILFVLCWGNLLQSFPSLFLHVTSCSATSPFHILLVSTLPSQIIQNVKVNHCLSLLDYFDFTNAFHCSIPTCISVLFPVFFDGKVSTVFYLLMPCTILYC